ncbi:MAG: DegT/DnrJ/EryC1/StrS family aminotransferase [Pseudomonadota bacterium]
MRTSFLPFSRPSIIDEDIAGVVEVLRSGWITTGSKNHLLEEAFCEYSGCPGAVALSSATAGMHVLLRAMDLGPGDEVVTPALTWVSTVNLICMAGATPVFADVDRDTLMVTKRTLESCITPRTRLIIPVHFAGAPVDMEPVMDLARERGIPVVEDAAHALGTRYRGQRIGAAGTSVFSFHPIKNITTGEGGMVCSDNKSLLERVRRLKFHGLGVDAFDRTTQGRSPQAEVLEPGYKYNLPDMQAVLGISQLRRVEDMNRKRAELAALYLEMLREVEEILPLALPRDPGSHHAWHLFVVRLDTDRTALTRDGFMDALKGQNIGTGLHFRSVHLQKYYRETMGYRPGMLPDTEWNSDRILSLPLFPDMNHDDVTDVVAAIKGVLHG